VTDALRVPVLWLYGADAVGKTTVAWEVYASLTGRGVPAAYVDTDYLGFGPPTADPDPSSLVAANLRAMWPSFAAVGATCLVVSGVVVSPEQRVRYSEAIPGTELTLVRLRASAETLAARIMRRGRIEGADSDGAATGLTLEGLREYGERAARFAEVLDSAGFADFAVDTDGVAVPEVAARVLERVPGWPAGTDIRA
jgi:hypothetical protein